MKHPILGNRCGDLQSYHPDFASWPWKRCRERLPREGEQPYYGRCDLRVHGPAIPHMLERGLVYVLWRIDRHGARRVQTVPTEYENGRLVVRSDWL